MKTGIFKTEYFVALAFILLVAGYGHLFYLHTTTTSALTSFASSTSDKFVAYEQKSVTLSDVLYASQQDLDAMKSRFGGFENSLGTLEKLSKTDPELLQKYSKVFFLNEHYAPERLGQIEPNYTYDENRPERINAQVQPYLEDMLNDAKDDGVELYVKSAYRSFEEQSKLKSAYSITYGAGTANTFSADQGYSEHQLGTTVDFISVGQNGELTGFQNTAAYQWLLKNAHKYGFILSYPQNNGYYIYEPWHWRFVGQDLASDLNRREKNFYDLEQREIDEYLAEIFD